MTDESRNFALLCEKFHDIKFDLDGTDYKAIETIGSGTYGTVCSAFQYSTGKRVAIKKIPNIFDNNILAKRTFRELMILRHFSHENVIKILDVLQPKEDETSFRDVYLVMDLMETDLYQVIRSKQQLTDEHIRYFIYQIACGLKYIHSANVIHRDLKPSNLLVNGNCLLKIADFGMARCISSDEGDRNSLMTWYVATRWYRAPELMLFKQKYTGAVDIWSVGCVLAELLGRKPLFPGRSFTNQVQLIFGILGSPNEEFVRMAHADRVKEFILSFGQKECTSLKLLYPNAHPKAIRLLEKMLRLNPKERISAIDVLSDLYVNQYHEPSTEPVAPCAFTFDLDEQSLDSCSLRRCVYEELIRPNGVATSAAVSDSCVKDAGGSKLFQNIKGVAGTTGINASLNQKSEFVKFIKSNAITGQVEPQNVIIGANNIKKCTNDIVKVSVSSNLHTSSALASGHNGVLDKSLKNANSEQICVESFALQPCVCSVSTSSEHELPLPLKGKLAHFSDSKAKTVESATSESQLKSNFKSGANKTNRRNHTAVNRNLDRVLDKKKTSKSRSQKSTAKSVNPVSLFNERGERINVKEVLKNTILGGHQTRDAGVHAGNVAADREPPVKTNSFEIQLSEDDKNLLKRWSDMQKQKFPNSESGKAVTDTVDSTAHISPAAAVNVSLPSVVEHLCTSSAENADAVLQMNCDDGPSVNVVPMAWSPCVELALTSSSTKWSPSVQLTSSDISNVFDMNRFSSEETDNATVLQDNGLGDNCNHCHVGINRVDNARNLQNVLALDTNTSFETSPASDLMSSHTVSVPRCDLVKVPTSSYFASGNGISVESDVGDRISPLFSPGKLSGSGYGIGMDFEMVLPDDFDNLMCDLKDRSSATSFLSGWPSDQKSTPDPEEILNLISNM